MASTFTPNTNLELQGTGDNPGAWGGVLNAACFTIVDQVLGGVQTLSLSNVNVTVTTSQSQNNWIKLTGTLTGNVIVTIPAVGRTFFISNATTGSFTVTLARSGGGTTIVIPQGTAEFFVFDSTGVTQPTTPAIAALIAAFTAASSSGAASLALAEDTDNGVNQVLLTVAAALSGNQTVTFPDASGTPALLELADQVVTGGARVTPLALNSGSPVTSGTLTPDPGDRPAQYYTNGGAHTLAPGSNNGYYLLDITNNASAGAITVSGWTKVVGSFTTTNGHKFRCGCSISQAGSLLTIQAMQ